MNRAILVVALPLFLFARPQQLHAVVDLDFDAAYMVAAAGSTDPVTVFDINGPAPCLYLDLPDAALSTFIAIASSDWFHAGTATKQFSISNSTFAETDKFWFSPSPDVWNSTKAAGDWHIDASHSLIQLIIIYGGGVGRVWATGNETINFTVASGSGDFNNDNIVDAADYIVWRKAIGSGEAGLGSEDNPSNPLTTADYDVWKSNFGNGGGGSAGNALSVVPEPTALIMLFSGLVAFVVPSRSRRNY